MSALERLSQKTEARATSFGARLEQAVLDAWFPVRQPDFGCKASDPAMDAIVWLLTRSWFARLAAWLVADLAKKRRSQRRVERAQKPPVVVIGNLVVGGSGKTPLVIALARHLHARGLRIGLLCGGYGGKREGLLEAANYAEPMKAWQAGWSDEAVLMAMHTEAVIAVAKDRKQAMNMCLKADPLLDLILSDDGLQHHGLERAVEVVLIDARGLGNRQCIPAGPLREPLSHRPPSDWALLRRPGPMHYCAEESPRQGADLELADIEQLAKCWLEWAEADIMVLGRSDWIAKRHEGMHLSNFAAQFRDRRLLGIAGISQPAVLARACARFGLDIHWLFPGDHRAVKLEPADLDPFEAVVMTAKDAVKYPQQRIPVYVLVQTVTAPESLCLDLERIAHGQPTT